MKSALRRLHAELSRSAPGSTLTLSVPAVPDATWLTRSQAVDLMCRRLERWRNHRNAARKRIERAIQQAELYAVGKLIEPGRFAIWLWGIFDLQGPIVEAM